MPTKTRQNNKSIYSIILREVSESATALFRTSSKEIGEDIAVHSVRHKKDKTTK